MEAKLADFQRKTPTRKRRIKQVENLLLAEEQRKKKLHDEKENRKHQEDKETKKLEEAEK